MKNNAYVIISPCRDEAQFLMRTIESVAAQSVPPELWVIVDDGSTDQTPQLLARAAEQHEFIRVIRRDDRGERSVGPGVIHAFDEGLKSIDLDQYEFVCKLDLDLILPPRYFETLIGAMEANPRLGCYSGKPYFIAEDGSEVSEGIGDDISVGASKFYRVSCFRQIGGFVKQVMWDGIDCHRCRMLGWVACSSDEPDLRFIHLRPMGASDKGIWTGRVRWGFGQYFMGTGLVWIMASAAYRMSRPPVILGGIGILWGYIKSALTRVPRYGDAEFRSFLRRFQLLCLLHGKREALRRINEQQASCWTSS